MQYITVVNRLVQAADFVTSSSGFPPANNNLYYITFWDDAVRERSGIATNAGNAQNQFIFKRRENFGNTNIAAALRDQEAAWAGPRAPLRRCLSCTILPCFDCS